RWPCGDADAWHGRCNLPWQFLRASARGEPSWRQSSVPLLRFFARAKRGDEEDRMDDRSAKVLVAVAIGAVLYFARAAFIPVALALVPSLVLSGPVEALQRRRVPRGVSAAVIVVVVLSLIAGAAASFWSPAQEWYAKAPQTVATIRAKVGPIARIMNRLDELR